MKLKRNDILWFIGWMTLLVIVKTGTKVYLDNKRHKEYRNHNVNYTINIKRLEAGMQLYGYFSEEKTSWLCSASLDLDAEGIKIKWVKKIDFLYKPIDALNSYYSTNNVYLNMEGHKYTLEMYSEGKIEVLSLKKTDRYKFTISFSREKSQLKNYSAGLPDYVIKELSNMTNKDMPLYNYLFIIDFNNFIWKIDENLIFNCTRKST